MACFFFFFCLVSIHQIIQNTWNGFSLNLNRISNLIFERATISRTRNPHSLTKTIDLQNTLYLSKMNTVGTEVYCFSRRITLDCNQSNRRCSFWQTERPLTAAAGRLYEVGGTVWYIQYGTVLLCVNNSTTYHR